MTYIVLKYDPKRDLAQYKTGLAFNLLLQDDDLEIVDSKLRSATNKSFMNMTADQLVAQIIKLNFHRVCELFKVTKEFKTDKALITACGDEYLGVVSGAIKKKDLQHIFDIQARAKAYEYLRNNTSTQLYADSYEALSLSNKEMHEYLAELQKGQNEKLAWIDAHSKTTMDAFKSLPILIKRDFK